MKNLSVTTQLIKSIEKVTGHVFQAYTFSDSRKQGKAVGVKVCYTQYSQPIIDQIIEDMASKGYTFDYVRYNKPTGPFPTIPGTRFCFYKHPSILHKNLAQ